MTASTTRGISFDHAEDTSLEIRVCPSCGVTYAIPVRLRKDRQEKGGSWYCPNGHTLSYTTTDHDRLKKEAADLRKKLDAEKANLDWWRQRADDHAKETDKERARANGYKGALTKVKKRVGNGVCPCCRRSFSDLHRHMASKHPGFAESDA